MLRGALTQNLDVAQVVLYAFWIFFAGLIFYIRQEDRREGYPLENDKTGERGPRGFPFIPDPKTFVLAHGAGTVSVPNSRRDDTRPIAAVRVGAWPGAALDPTGNPLLDGVGPASWAERADRPDMLAHGGPRIVPLRAAPDYSIAEQDADPRGYKVFGCDEQSAGKVTEVWVDKGEFMSRFFEITTNAGKTALVPVNFTVIDDKRGIVYVHALRSDQFDDVPGVKTANQITLLEEEKVMAYFGGGTLYAKPQRLEPLL